MSQQEKPKSPKPTPVERPVRRPYTPPRMTEYGPVSKLTRSGKGSIIEGTDPAAMMACL